MKDLLHLPEQPLLLHPHKLPHPLLRHSNGYTFYENWPSWGCLYVDWVALDADQMAGGVLIMWDRWVLEKLEVLVGLFLVSVQWKDVEDGFI